MEKVKSTQINTLMKLPLRAHESKQCLALLRQHSESSDELVVFPLPMTLSDFAVKYTMQSMQKND